MSLERIDELLAKAELPPLRKLEGPEIGEGDVLVTCAGFEDRAFEFLRRAERMGVRGFHVIAIDYLPSIGANRKEELAACANTSGASARWITYDREAPEDPTDDVLVEVDDRTRLFIDISGMSRLLIVQLVAGAIRLGKAGHITLIYSEATEYPPTHEEFVRTIDSGDELFDVIQFVSSGVFEIIVRPELSTTAMYGQPIRVVAFPTFNSAQLASVCAEVNASAFTIVNGKPPRADYAWRINAIRTLNNISSLREVEERTTSTLDYRETVAMLLDVYRRHGGREKLVVVPTGSKMQSVALAIVVGFVTDLQVVYPAPRNFPAPAKYTQGVQMTYALDLSKIIGMLPLRVRLSEECETEEPSPS